MTNSTVSANRAAAGGGIYVHTIHLFTRTGYYVIGSATLNSCTISENESQGNGGGISARRVYLQSSTVSSNKGNSGGGIFSHNDASISDSTITGNVALHGPAGGLWNGDDQSFPGRTYFDPSVVTIERSIIAGNTANGDSADLHPGGGSLSFAASLIGDNAGTPLGEAQSFDSKGNLIGSSVGRGIIDPRLAPLADNGGPTRTHAPLPNSPALDAIEYYAGVPIPAHDYELSGSLSDLQGGPTLVALGGTLADNGYYLGPNQGLSLSSAVANPAEYSLEVVFKWTNLSGGWQKIVDFHNLTSDVGLYTAGSGLHFVDRAFTGGLFSANTIYHLVLTRNAATDIVRAYINGDEVWNFVDSQDAAVLDGPNNIIRFFQDDTATGHTQAQSGFVDRIRIYNRALSLAEVAAIYNAQPIALPDFDQRGTPFVRVQDGDRDGIPRADMGAFELQVTATPVLHDYGDAPDSGAGTATGNYNTLAADNGPRHTIVAGLRMGASVDGDSGTLQNVAANADDVIGAMSDDEGGVSDPTSDLVLTIGAQPTVNLRVTNTTGSAATLFGWIDYNANGVFENATERASIPVPNGTNNSVVTLVFPAVSAGFTGTTYARFRLSTDVDAADPTGEVADGEIEDYRATITRPGSGVADSTKNRKIASGTGGGPMLADGEKFGSAVASVGDLDGDGIGDLLVGAPVENGKPGSGSVYVLFLNSAGTVKASQRISSGIGGGLTLAAGDYFGHSVASLGDLDGDGVTDLAVGASKDDTGGYINGAVYVLSMNANGTVKSSQKIASGVGGGPALATGDRFGSSLASLGDLDGDGIGDLAVGAISDDTGGNYRGAVHVLFLNSNGTVKGSQKIASGVGGGPLLSDFDVFGISVASLGDLDGDGITELAVGAFFDDTSGTGRGAVHVLFLNSNGTVKGSQKIASGVGGGPVLSDGDYFGRSVASLGDLDGDGVTDLAVGAYRDDTGGSGRGALHVLFMNANGTVRTSQKIASSIGGGPTLANDDRFGSGVAAIGDLDGDGRIELAVGAETDDTGGTNRGAVHVLFLTGANTSPVFTSPDSVSVPENTTSVLTVTAIDTQSSPQTITYSIVGGPDQAKFSITSDGALSFVTPPNFEAPTDAGGDNAYVVIVQASDGSLNSLQAIVVMVTLVNDNSPVITSPAAATVMEKTTAVMVVSATDADLPAQSVTLSITGGADRTKFSLVGRQLTFIAPPDSKLPTDADSNSIYEVVVQADDGNGRTTLQTILVTVIGLPSDYGDAPDAANGTGTGNYNTRAADGGPRHTIVPGLRIGANVDGETGTLQNAAANADDVNAALPDDEDGLTNPAADLVLTAGAQPTVNLRVTNITAAAATLYGWIDYNANGVFDNAMERASVPVPNGANNGIVTLVFAPVPPGFHGTTYARFRLSTDAAAANPTGVATGGEVEDYIASILKPSEPAAGNAETISGFGGRFGSAVTSIGDLNGDGVTDLAVGAAWDDGLPGTPLFSGRGAIHMLFMNSDGTVKSSRKIAHQLNGGPTLAHYAGFGSSLASLGDLDGDGVTELAVAAAGGGFSRSGEVYVLFMKTDGTAKRHVKATSGTSVASLGDFDGDGVNDMAVGQAGSFAAVVFLNSNGTVKDSQGIQSGVPDGPSHSFGSGVASLGDIDGDGVTDIAVGAPNLTYNAGGNLVYVFFLNSNGTVKGRQTITGGPGFGTTLASLGDLDGDGVTDLAVGSPNSSRIFNGQASILLLNSNGTLKRSRELGSGSGFGISVASIGDLDGDGLTDLAVGEGAASGLLHLYFLKPFNNSPVFTSPASASVPENTTNPITIGVMDADIPPQMIALAVVDGPDQDEFTIAAGGVLKFKSPPDFDAPADADGDNVYEVVVQANDGNGGFATQTISITVTPLNDHAPAFTSTDSVTIAENTTSVLTVTATDADLPPQTVIYSLVGGSDQSKFNITPGGALSFKSPPNFEAPTDVNGDNVYIVIVQASDGSLTNLQAILVTVTNTSEVSLVGDYNNSGTVDLADYVVWRNALNQAVTLPNDSTPGMVTQADHDVWRANFGRTAPAGTSTPGTTPRPVPVRDRERDPEADSTQESVSTLFVDVVYHQSVPRLVRTRPSPRTTLAPATSHDDALIAWLTSCSDMNRRIHSAAFSGFPAVFDKTEHLEPSIAEIDIAFAAG